jgi:hypothetical protein
MHSPFIKGLLSAVVGAVAMTVALSQSPTPSQVAVAGAVLGGGAYLVGWLHGRAAERAEPTPGVDFGDGEEVGKQRFTR